MVESFGILPFTWNILPWWGLALLRYDYDGFINFLNQGWGNYSSKLKLNWEKHFGEIVILVPMGFN